LRRDEMAKKQAVQEPEAQESDATDTEVTSERMTGVKKSARNVIGVVTAQREEDQDGEPSVAALPKFFIDSNDRIKVELVVMFNKKSGELLNISLKEFRIDLSKLTFLGSSVEWFEFSRPTYDGLSSYRQKSMLFDKTIGKMLVDPVRLRNFLIVFHLKAWSIRDNEGKPQELGFNGNALDSSALKVVDKVHPTMLDIVLSKFETEILLQ
jgi:hypothetical protein